MVADCCKTSSGAHNCRSKGTGPGNGRRLAIGQLIRLFPVVLRVHQHQVVLNVQPTGCPAAQGDPMIDHHMNSVFANDSGQPICHCHGRMPGPARFAAPVRAFACFIVAQLSVVIRPLPVGRPLFFEAPVNWVAIPLSVPLSLALDANILPTVQPGTAHMKGFQRFVLAAVAAMLQLHARTEVARRIRSCTVALPGKTSSQTWCSRVPRATRTCT